MTPHFVLLSYSVFFFLRDYPNVNLPPATIVKCGSQKAERKEGPWRCALSSLGTG